MIYDHNSKSGGWTYQTTNFFIYLIELFSSKLTFLGYFGTETLTSKNVPFWKISRSLAPRITHNMVHMRSGLQREESHQGSCLAP